jgi:hypothetical protein
MTNGGRMAASNRNTTTNTTTQVTMEPTAGCRHHGEGAEGVCPPRVATRLDRLLGSGVGRKVGAGASGMRASPAVPPATA